MQHRQGTTTVPTVADLFAMALQNHQASNLAQAERLYQQVLQSDPNHADSHHLLGALALQLGRFSEAVTRIRHALALNPTAGGYHSNLGVAYEGLGQMEQAAACFQEALRVQPDCAEAHCNLGKALLRQGKLDDALAHCQRALQLMPNFPEAQNHLGNVLLAQGKFEEAETSYRQTLRLSPQSASAWNNLGIANDKQDKLEDAVRHYQEALRLDPGHVDAWNNLAYVKMRQGDFDEAMKGFDKALRLQPDYALPHWNRSVLRLLMGDYEQGWPEYEWRWVEHAFARRPFTQPVWDGSDLGGKSILLHAEQGIGDALQFIRYAALVKDRHGKVIVECHVPLLRLLANTPGIDQLVPWGSPPPPFDVHLPLLSLPRIFNTTVATIPAKVPYVFADPALIDQWGRELEPLSALKVGIAWQGNPQFPGDRQRSIPLRHFQSLAETKGVRFISLQKGPGADQLPAFNAELTANGLPVVLDLSDRLDEKAGPFMDTAAVMKNLDLVICADTAIAHLAGSLGVPAWVALNLVPDWRWLLHREDSAWYPTLKLFRQVKLGRWEDVFQSISEELKSRTAELAN